MLISNTGISKSDLRVPNLLFEVIPFEITFFETKMPSRLKLRKSQFRDSRSCIREWLLFRFQVQLQLGIQNVHTSSWPLTRWRGNRCWRIRGIRIYERNGNRNCDRNHYHRSSSSRIHRRSYLVRISFTNWSELARAASQWGKNRVCVHLILIKAKC